MKSSSALIVLLLFLAAAEDAQGACCSWSDKNACATCPTGYISGCRTDGNKCECSCSQSNGELLQYLSFGAPWAKQEIQTEIKASLKKDKYAKQFTFKLDDGSMVEIVDTKGILQKTDGTIKR